MTLQSLCHGSAMRRSCLAAVLATSLLCAPTQADPTRNDYPTQARVEYVNDCIAANGASLSSLYQCSCVIDRIAEQLTYDDFVEASTYSRYASLPGEAGGLFRDSDKARKLAKLFRDTEAEASRQCGLGPGGDR